MKENMQVDYDDIEESINQNELRSAASSIRKRIYSRPPSSNERIVNEIIRDFAEIYVENELPIIDEVNIVTTKYNEKVGITNDEYNGIYSDESYVLPMRRLLSYPYSKERTTRMIRKRLNLYIAKVVNKAIESERRIMDSHTPHTA